VFAGRRVAAAHVAALLTLPERHPEGAGPETLLAAFRCLRRREVPGRQTLEMLTLFCHDSSYSPTTSTTKLPGSSAGRGRVPGSGEAGGGPNCAVGRNSLWVLASRASVRAPAGSRRLRRPGSGRASPRAPR